MENTQHTLRDSLERDNLESIYSILEDETDQNQLADDFIVSCIEEVRQLKTY